MQAHYVTVTLFNLRCTFTEKSFLLRNSFAHVSSITQAVSSRYKTLSCTTDVNESRDLRINRKLFAWICWQKMMVLWYVAMLWRKSANVTDRRRKHSQHTSNNHWVHNDCKTLSLLMQTSRLLTNFQALLLTVTRKRYWFPFQNFTNSNY